MLPALTVGDNGCGGGLMGGCYCIMMDIYLPRTYLLPWRSTVHGGKEKPGFLFSCPSPESRFHAADSSSDLGTSSVIFHY